MLVHHHQAGDHALAGEVDRRRAAGDSDPGEVADRGDVAVAQDQRLILARRRAGAVDHAHVGQRDDRRFDLDVGASGFAGCC